jgi:hypothetical protein
MGVLLEGQADGGDGGSAREGEGDIVSLRPRLRLGLRLRLRLWKVHGGWRGDVSLHDLRESGREGRR